MCPQHISGAPADAAANRRRLSLTLGIMAVYMAAEVVGGLITNSLALLADAGHMLTDVAALGLSLFALRMAARTPTSRRTYGWHRMEILAALANGVTLVTVALFILFEAWRRFQNPPQVQGALMFGIATGGLAVNALGLYILGHGRGQNLNVRGAWLHVLTDAMGSVGAMASGALIWALDWRWADPLASVLIAMLVVYSSWSLLRETVEILLEGAPGHIDVEEVRRTLSACVPGIRNVRDLHIWTISSGRVALTARVVPDDFDECSKRDVLIAIHDMLSERFGIHHATIQIEPAEFLMPDGPF